MSKYVYDEKLLNKAIELLENGKSITAIAAELGVCRRTLSDKLEALGYKSKYAKKKVNYIYDYSSDKFKNIAKLYDDGMSLEDLSSKYSISTNTVKKCLKRYGIELRPTYYRGRNFEFNIDMFETIDTEEKAYWLGFLYADGYVNGERYTIELGLQEKDYNHLVKFANFLGLNSDCVRKKTNTVNGKKFISYRVIVHSKKMYSDLVSLGCIQNKSLILKYPKLKNKIYKHFIRGYFDGDGSISVYKNNSGHLATKLSFLGTNDMLCNISSYISNNGKNIDNKTPKFIKRSNIYEICYGGPFLIERVYNTFYKNSSIYLDRKREKFIAVLEYNRRKF